MACTGIGGSRFDAELQPVLPEVDLGVVDGHPLHAPIAFVPADALPRYFEVTLAVRARVYSLAFSSADFAANAAHLSQNAAAMATLLNYIRMIIVILNTFLTE